ncbi:unnamed protein product, partial [Phaeothamnion confervicola]
MEKKGRERAPRQKTMWTTHTHEERMRLKRELEADLRLVRLREVREQSDQHAATMRRAYAERRSAAQRMITAAAQREEEAKRRAELEALNLSLQQALLDVGQAHRLASASHAVSLDEEERARAAAAAAAKARRERAVAAVAVAD